MSEIVYCADNACFHKQLCDEPDDVIKLSWAKVVNGKEVKYLCPTHTWEIEL